MMTGLSVIIFGLAGAFWYFDWSPFLYVLVMGFACVVWIVLFGDHSSSSMG